MKWCYICREEKSEAEFHRNGGRRDGLAAECKECSTAQRRRRRQENGYPPASAAAKERATNWRRRNPDKWRAQSLAQSALRRGVLTRPDGCLVCDGPKPVAHHEDYSKPLEVIWLCRSCHAYRHIGKLELHDRAVSGQTAEKEEA